MSIDSPQRRPPRNGTRRAVAIIVIVVLVLAALAYWLAHSVPQPTGGGRFGGGPSGPGGGRGGGLPMPVGTATVARGDINLVLDALGTVTPLRSVTVTAQVAGQLKSVQFKEGQLVQQGDLLAEIDPRAYQAALTQAQGALARDQAQLANAKIDLARYQTLFQQDSIARQQLDAQAALVRQYDGTTTSDQGQIDTAKVNLGYTRIVAPVTGRVGLRQVDPGNNVAVGSSIVVVTQLKPIDVLFAVPEDNLPAVLKKLHSGATMTVLAFDRAGTNKLAEGTLASLDNQVDTATGTVKAKAEFANADESLFPNQFVNVRLLLDTLHDTLVIPTSSLQRGAAGLFVYIVQADKTATAKTITTGPTEGERVAVTSGLNLGDVVVTSGADRLREGSKVELPGDNPPPAAARDASKPAGEQAQHPRRDGSAAGVKPARDAGTKPADDKKP